MTTHPHLRVFSAVIAEGLSKNLHSDDHFDRSFSFMAVEGKPRKQKEKKITTPQLTNPVKRQATSHLTKEQQ